MSVDRYKLLPEEIQFVRRYARRYPRWKKTYNMTVSLKSQQMNHLRVQTSGKNHPTEAVALKKAELSKKILLIEQTARQTDIFLWRFVLLGVTEPPKTVTYEKMVLRGINCSKNTYYDRCRRFYWLLNKKLKMIRNQDPGDNGCEAVEQVQQADQSRVEQ